MNGGILYDLLDIFLCIKLNCVKKSDLLDQEIENELNEIKNLEYDITNINESLDESNNSLNVSILFF